MRSFIIILIIVPSLCFAEVEEDFTGYKTGEMMNQTRDALLSYELVQHKTNYWGQRLEKMLFGNYAHKFFLLSRI